MQEPRPLLARRLKRGWLIAFDVVAAGVLLVTTTGNLSARTWDLPMTVPIGLVWVLAAAVPLPVAARRLWPDFAFWLGVVLAILTIPVGGPVREILPLVIAFPLYTVAAHAPRRRALTVLVAGLMSTAISGVFFPDGTTLAALAFTVGALTAAWALGRGSYERRAYAEREVRSYADHAVAEERLRIAREMHDVVAHSMSLIAVKAAVGNHVAVEQPEEARDALRVIEATSRDALTEMRRMLGVLRSELDDSTVAELGPAPTATDLHELADRASTAGIRVELDARGVEDLTEGLGLSVYRIVQEALTNVVKHAASGRCRVTVVADGREVRIEVVDDGHGEPVLIGPAGHGLIGMRERVSVYGGDFTAAPRAESGFRVFARLPYERSGVTA
jgi:signal transduction histidine kinase